MLAAIATRLPFRWNESTMPWCEAPQHMHFTCPGMLPCLQAGGEGGRVLGVHGESL